MLEKNGDVTRDFLRLTGIRSIELRHAADEVDKLAFWLTSEMPKLQVHFYSEETQLEEINKMLVESLKSAEKFRLFSTQIRDEVKELEKELLLGRLNIKDGLELLQHNVKVLAQINQMTIVLYAFIGEVKRLLPNDSFPVLE